MRKSMWVFAAATLVASVTALPASAAPPSNDAAAGATVVAVGGVVEQSVVDATPDTLPVCFLDNTDARSVWFQVDVPVTGVTMDTLGSDYDTRMEVMTDPTLPQTTTVACNDDAEADLTSRVDVLTAGTYFVRVDAWSDNLGGGSLRFSVTDRRLVLNSSDTDDDGACEVTDRGAIVNPIETPDCTAAEGGVTPPPPPPPPAPAPGPAPTPQAVDDDYTTAVDTSLEVPDPGVLGNDTPQTAPLVAALATDPGNGTVDLATTGGFTYTPDAGFVGTDTFTYTATRSGVRSAPATVTIVVGEDEVDVTSLSAAEGDNVSRAIAWAQLTEPDDTSFAGQEGRTVLIGRDDTFADSLASGGAQGVLDAPLLLTGSASLDARTAEEIARLGATRAVLLGGTAALSAQVATDLVAQGLEVDRLEGATRIETAVAIAEAVAPAATQVVLARAFGLAEPDEPTQAFADALSAGALAAERQVPLLLTATEGLSASTAAHLADAEVTDVVIVGGTSAVSPQVVADLEALDIAVTRAAGATRVETAVAIAGERGAPTAMDADGAVLVDGTDPDAWADAFPAALFAGSSSTPIVLADGDTLPEPTSAWLTGGGVPLVCGTTVEQAVCDAAANALASTPPQAKANDVAAEEVPVVQAQEGSTRTPAAAPATSTRHTGPPVVVSNTTPITITDCPNPCPASGQQASLYPSPIVVPAGSGVVERVSVTLNGYGHSFPADVDVLLESPDGRTSVLMSDLGAGSPGVSNLGLTLDDYADHPVPSTTTGNTGVPFVTGSYRPANSGTTENFPAPAPPGPHRYTLSAFNGMADPGGTWNLYVIDDANLDNGSISGGWTITFDVRPPAPAAGDIVISEFRTRGEGTTPPASDGSADEFIQLTNTTDQSITIVDATPGADPTSLDGAGWRVGAATGAAATADFVVLSQTSSTAGPIALPPHGHFLIATQPAVPDPAGNTYSLTTYPTGTGVTASGSANLNVNPLSATQGFLPDDVGLTIFSSAVPATAARLDSVAYGTVTAPDYQEGAGLSATPVTEAGQHSWVRRMLPSGVPQDTDVNAEDFQLVSVTGDTLSGVPSVLGSPGPERGPTMTAFTTSSAPLVRTSMGMTPDMPASVIDPMRAANVPPNQRRNADGTLEIFRQFRNDTGLPIVALRYRVTAISTLTGGAVPAGQADLRLMSSPQQVVTLTDASTVTAQATTVQTPPAVPAGGGLNTSVVEGVITTTTPLADGATTIVGFRLCPSASATTSTCPVDPEAIGKYRFAVQVEALTVPPE